MGRSPFAQGYGGQLSPLCFSKFYLIKNIFLLAVPTEARKSESWRYLIDAFKEHRIEYDFSLNIIQRLFTSLNIKVSDTF